MVKVKVERFCRGVVRRCTLGFIFIVLVRAETTSGQTTACTVPTVVLHTRVVGSIYSSNRCGVHGWTTPT
jgi:hypothetical protein